ncbi:MAG: HAMP domain-containing histidine kinase [Spirulinaceae cyanobacterium RM2_2_10]|nr:HAMP domain-containing histidine kinase [Spirulinaceae cyanobacterium SM2_1_0]NJO20818.1 HAMP domain-containing histidine kinase [Spirulinaceae cyanobacterium RM2_2_10]
MAKLSLITRLFLSHLLVMVVGLGSFIAIAKLSSPRFFVFRLEQLEQRGVVTVRSARTYLVRGFESAWNASAIWSILAGATAAGGLSYWVARRIAQPLEEMRQVTQDFAGGNLQVRALASDIPELNQLATSFNRMAGSIEGVEQRRRELISDLTHELRSPLTVVRGYLEELAADNIEPSPELYLRLVREARRLERLTRDLQELSKAEAGHLPINPRPVKLRPLLMTLVERFVDQVIDGDPAFKLDCPETLPPVLADADRLEQVLVNLLGNALRYTESGEIRVQAWSEGARLWVAVSDTGIGIAPDDLPLVFERFWRADRARSRESGGTGIGLAIARRLIELQNGHIEVESELGVGSTFRFWLPTA